MWTPKQNRGWETTSQDYYAHGMPNVMTDVPQYPNVYKAYNNKVTYEEDCGAPHKRHDRQHRHPHFSDKVEVIEYEEIVEEGRNGKGRDKVEVIEYERVERNRNGNHEVYEKKIDIEADGYIQQKHKGFELSRWGTNKVR
jgi:hypothetical protein|uniref:Uncharacterized protein n=1 Tax=Fagus sylvatica TaxID=28930 RepID=A0A2N9IWG9_FAGSY